MSRPVRLAAIVLNFGTPDDSWFAVRSLARSRRPVDELIVVDNDEAPGCEARMAACSHPVRYHRTGHNLGFAGGMNVGITMALERGADLVLLMNSDAVVMPETVGLLEETLGRSQDGHGLRRGIAGPRLVARTAPDVVASDGMRFGARTGRLRHILPADLPSDAPPERIVDAVSGCVMLVHADVFKAIGLLDEPYFFSVEDLDFCLRARHAGFASVVTSAATAWHEGSRSIGARSTERLYYVARNHLRLAARVAPLPAGARMARNASVVALNVAHAVTTQGGTMGSRVAAVLRGTRDHFRGRYGPAT